MRKFLIFIWLLMPLGLAAFHYGPGQEMMKGDTSSGYLSEARGYLADENYIAAVESFDAAIKDLPEGKEDTMLRLRLEKAKAQMHCSGLPDAHESLVGMLDELAEDKTADPAFVAEAKSTLANAQYYMTWLMRLEGHPREVWEPTIEAARQNYRATAEFATSNGNAKATTTAREDLEAAIKLARIDLSELQGLPLPSQ